MNETVLWIEGLHIPASADPPPAQVDVVVIGGGITGLTAALALAQHGARVALFEAHQIGWGAASRNGGMVLTGLKVGVAGLLKTYGAERARRLFDASKTAIDLVEQIITREAIGCDFARTGHLVLASKPQHAVDFETEADLLRTTFGHATRILARSALHDEIGSSIYHGGMIDEASAGIDPARYLAGLAAAAQRHGALLFDRAAVQQISGNPGNFVVETARGNLRADQIFVATAGYTGAITPRLRRRVIPVGSYIIATEPLGALAHQLIPRARQVFDTKHFLHYYRLTPDGRLLFGGRARFTPETRDSIRAAATILQRDMLTVFPQLRDIQVAYAWGGTVDFTFDQMPHAGELGGLHYALGYAGHGVAMATYLGTQFGAKLAGAAYDNPLHDIAPPRAPLALYDGRPYFLPLAGLYYRILDVLY